MAFSNVEQLEPTRVEQMALRGQMATLMDGLKAAPADERPPHPITFSDEKLAQVSKQAAAVIHTAAPRLEQAIVRMAKEQDRHAVLIRKMPFETDLPKPADDDQLVTRVRGGTNDYFENQRRGTFSDFFTLGVMQIIHEATGYRSPTMGHGEIRNSLERAPGQPFHRDFSQYGDPLAPRFSTFSCHAGNFSAYTDLLDLDAAVAALTPEQRKILSEPHFKLEGKNIKRGVIGERNGRPFIGEPHMMTSPTEFEGDGPQADDALEALIEKIGDHTDRVNLRAGDFMILDQKHLLHRGSAQLPFLNRHVSGIFFKGCKGSESYEGRS